MLLMWWLILNVSTYLCYYKLYFTVFIKYCPQTDISAEAPNIIMYGEVILEDLIG